MVLQVLGSPGFEGSDDLKYGSRDYFLAIFVLFLEVYFLVMQLVEMHLASASGSGVCLRRRVDVCHPCLVAMGMSASVFFLDKWQCAGAICVDGYQPGLGMWAPTEHEHFETAGICVHAWRLSVRVFCISFVLPGRSFSSEN